MCYGQKKATSVLTEVSLGAHYESFVLDTEEKKECLNVTQSDMSLSFYFEPNVSPITQNITCKYNHALLGTLKLIKM